MPERYRSGLLDFSGAVEADPPDAGVAAHYGHLAAEQRALISGESFVDLSHRDVIAVNGPDRLALLHAVTSQHFEGLGPGRPIDAYILSPQGHIEHAFSGVDDGETFSAHTEPGAGAALADFLDRMKFMMRLEVLASDPSRVVLGTWDRELGVPAWQFVGPEALTGADTTPAGIWAYEALRIQAGLARFGLDTDERTIPNEILPESGTDVLGTFVHLAKGCYRGQETVARVHNLGRPPRRLVRLQIDGSTSALPRHGDTVLAGDTPVGTIGSAARHHEDGPIALALVKRNTPVDETLIVAQGSERVAALQEVVVDPEVGLHVRPKVSGR